MKIRLLVLSLCLLASCKEKVREEMQLIVRNGTGYPMAVKMYPQFDYSGVGGLYKMSDKGSGSLSTDFDLSPGTESILFYSKSVSQLPEALFAKVFKGISARVTMAAGEHYILIDQNGQEGYLKDPSKEKSEWVYEVRETDRPTQLKRNPVRVHSYTFIVTEDNFDPQ